MLLFTLLFSCALVSEDDFQERVDSLALFDNDGDGYRSGEDCDDNDPTVPVPWYLDGDGDGFGWNDDMILDCGIPEGYVENNQDCDDGSADITPLDLDGDGASICDGDCDDNDPYLNILDEDGDGYSICDFDCDDLDPFYSPADLDGGGQSTCYGDCDDDNPALSTLDLDGDGFTSCEGDCDDLDPMLDPFDWDWDGFSRCEGDCDDYNPYVHPDALEISFDGVDQDCDGEDDSATTPSWTISYVEDVSQASAEMNDSSRYFFSWTKVGSSIALLSRDDISSSDVWIIDSSSSPRIAVESLGADVDKARLLYAGEEYYIAYTKGALEDASWRYKGHPSLGQLLEDIYGRTGVQDFTALKTVDGDFRMSYIIDDYSNEWTEWNFADFASIEELVAFLNQQKISDARLISFDGDYGVFVR